MATIAGTADADTLVGGSENDLIFGLAGNDSLSGDAGDDSLDGGSGNDTLRGGEGDSDDLFGSLGDDVIDGGPGVADIANYSGAPDPLTIDLAAGTALGAGQDTLIDIEVVFAGTRNDTVSGSDNADALFGFGGNDSLVGRGGNDFLAGGSGNDSLSGGSGDDYLGGGTGDDTLDGGDGSADELDYSGSAAALLVDLVAGTATGEGSDVLFGIERLLLSDFDDTVSGSAAAEVLVGGAGGDSLGGLGGNDEIWGGTGDDTLDGGDGIDVLRFSASAAAVTVNLAEGTATGEGSDQISAFEIVALSGFDDVFTGDANANLVSGASGNDSLSGLDGDDELLGNSGDDTIDGGQGSDTVYFAGNFADYHFEFDVGVVIVVDDKPEDGNDGSDRLSGVEVLRFADGAAIVSDLDVTDDIINMTGPLGGSFAGGPGNDIYIVDDPLDVPTEDPAEGTDTVRSSISWTLAANFENLVLTGTASINGTGNELRNQLTGNDGANALLGGAGNDTLEGGLGADTLEGELGNDTYIVGTEDIVNENSSAGIDTVRSDVSWTLTLSPNVERLILTGTGAISGTGNAGSNVITGNQSANQLDGGAGLDRLSGLGGNDTISGGLGKDRLNGGVGNDVLFGGAGNDTLTGSLGADAFVFDTRLSALANVDLITDFTPGRDKLRLDDDVFKAFDASLSTTLKAGQFVSGPDAQDALDATDRIIYDTTTGKLYYDADGTGTTASPIHFATLGKPSGAETHPQLSAADFIIVT